MDKKSQTKLESIVVKEIKALTEHDIIFLKARRSYLTEEQMDKYKSVINPVSASKKSNK